MQVTQKQQMLLRPMHVPNDKIRCYAWQAAHLEAEAPELAIACGHLMFIAHSTCCATSAMVAWQHGNLATAKLSPPPTLQSCME